MYVFRLCCSAAVPVSWSQASFPPVLSPAAYRLWTKGLSPRYGPYCLRCKHARATRAESYRGMHICMYVLLLLCVRRVSLSSALSVTHVYMCVSCARVQKEKLLLAEQSSGSNYHTTYFRGKCDCNGVTTNCFVLFVNIMLRCDLSCVGSSKHVLFSPHAYMCDCCCTFGPNSQVQRGQILPHMRHGTTTTELTLLPVQPVRVYLGPPL